MTEDIDQAKAKYAKNQGMVLDVLYLDLDGTVRQGKDDPLNKFVNGPEDVRVFPEAVERMREWKNSRPPGIGRIVGVTNQGGVALGLLSERNMRNAIVETMSQAAGLFDAVFVCTHHPSAPDPLLARCWCRKPNPGAIIEAAQLLRSSLEPARLHPDYPSGHSVVFMPPHRALFVGDREEDKQAADAAGVRFMNAIHWRAGAKYEDYHGELL